MEMDDQYALSDLRHLMTTPPSRSHFPSSSSIPHHDLFSSSSTSSAAAAAFRHHHHHHHTPYDLIMMMPRDTLPDFRSDSAATPPAVVSTPTAPTAFELETASLAADCATPRWPRQETLTLLDIRSRLDSKFKEANQKGPLWDEVSRTLGKGPRGTSRFSFHCKEREVIVAPQGVGFRLYHTAHL
ncbi:Trihelix transcription factor PTL, partial [Cucurbita argyrosperma subsp. sororia]